MGDTLKLPPIDPDPQHCERAFMGQHGGQANAVQDRPLDLRECALPSADLKAKTLSGALMSKSDFSGSNMQEAVLPKVYAVDSDFSGVDFTSAVIDRAALMGPSSWGPTSITPSSRASAWRAPTSPTRASRTPSSARRTPSSSARTPR